MFSHFFIERPIFATVLSVVIVIVGGVALIGLPIDQYPDVVPPTVSVTAIYPGANAATVAEVVATPIEQEVNGVENMLYMSSQSTNDGQMTLTVTFKLGTNLDIAQVLVQNRVSIALAKLPEEVRNQGVTTKKKSPSITLCINLISPNNTYDQLFLSNYATINLKDAIARLDGVGDVTFLGGLDYSMRIWLDPQKLASRGMTANDVVNAIREQNVQVAAGRIGQPPVPKGVDFQYAVNAQGRLKTKEEFDRIVIKTGSDGEVVRIGDVGRVDEGAKSYDVTCFLDGQPSVALAVFQLPGSNAIATAEAVREEMEKLKARFPKDLEYRIVYDTTEFVEKSIETVVHTLFEAIGLVFIVVLVFLQNWRATVIPLIAVPVSLIGTFAVMALLGFSLNNLSLFGLVLAIGIVVDDAIVVVENVERNMELGLAPREATHKAMDEVAGPVIAVALVLSAVFVPTAFITGISGEFYRQFALTIAVSTVISAFNSLTMSPALSAILLKPRHDANDPLTKLLNLSLGWFFSAFNFTLDKSTNVYTRFVSVFIRGTALILLCYIALLGLTYVGFTAVPTGFIPSQDQGYLIVNAQLPDAASLQRTEVVSARLRKTILGTPGVAHTLEIPGYSMLTSTNQSNVSTLITILTPFEERTTPELYSEAIAQTLRKECSAEQEALVAVFGAPPIQGLGTSGGFKLQVQDRGAAGYAALQGATDRLIDAGNQQPAFVGLFTSFRADQPQLYVDINRVKAKAAGVSLGDLFNTLQVYLGSMYTNDYTKFGRNWQVNVQADAAFRLTPKDIGQLKVRNNKGEMVPLGTLVDVKDSAGPAIVNHYNMYPSAEINGNNAPGISSGQSIALMGKLADENLPATMGFEWTDITYQQILAGNTAVFVFPLCVVFVFLTLAAQYESWSMPLAIILIVPMCLLCAIVGVWLRGMDNNIFTQIGFVVLVGLASKNAILIVEFAKERQDHGLGRVEAAIEASKLRLRPILMTSFAFILGVVPLVLASGAGAEMRRALGTAVFSGMLGVTFFGIFLTPVFYVTVRYFSEKREAAPAPATTAHADASPTPDEPA